MWTKRDAFLSSAIFFRCCYFLILCLSYIDENIHKHNANNIITIWLLVMAFGNIVLSHKNRCICLFSNESRCVFWISFSSSSLYRTASQAMALVFFFCSSLTARNTLIQPWMKRRKKVDFQFEVASFFFLFSISFYICFLLYSIYTIECMYAYAYSTMSLIRSITLYTYIHWIFQMITEYLLLKFEWFTYEVKRKTRIDADIDFSRSLDGFNSNRW